MPSLRRRSAPTARGSSPRADDGTAKVWDARTGAEILTLKGHTWYSLVGVVQPRRVAGRSPASQDKTAKVWDAKTGAEILTLKGHTGSVYSASFSPDGSRILTASEDKTAKVWDAQDRCRDPHPQGAHRIASSRRRSARTGRGSSPRVMTGRRRSGTRGLVPRSSPSTGHTGVRSVRRRSAPTARGSSPRVGIRQHGEGLGRATAPSSSPSRGTPADVWSASFSPDGSRIVTGSDDRTAKVWDARTGAESSPSRGTPVTSGRRRSAPTARGSSPGVRTRRRRSGTRGAVPSSSRSRGTLVRSVGVVQPRRLARRHRE